MLRCLLYSDDFQPFQFKNASCGGLYLLPLSIPPWARAGVHAIRILGLTPPGVSSENAIAAVTSDLVKTGSTGVEVTLPDDLKIILFIDVVAYVGDYPENAKLLDVTGVNGCSPCTMCTFPRADKGSGDNEGSLMYEGSSYAYSTALHSANLSFRRTRQRMQLCREGATSNDPKRFGLREMGEEQRSKLSLHRLSEELDKARVSVPMTTSGEPAVPCFFDPYVCSLVAPDHVLFGTGEDVVKAMLRVLRPTQRSHFNCLALEALASAGHDVEGTFISTSTQQLNQMTFSSFNTLLLVAPWAMRIAANLQPPRSDIDETAFNALPKADAVLYLVYAFQDLYFSTIWVPRETINGEESVNSLEGKHWADYIRGLQKKATLYVEKVNLMCKR